VPQKLSELQVFIHDLVNLLSPHHEEFHQMCGFTLVSLIYQPVLVPGNCFENYTGVAEKRPSLQRCQAK
jgi:hypothetical protein